VAYRKVLRFAQDDTWVALCVSALLLLALPLRAQDAIVVAANADRLRDATGGGASAVWIHPRGADTFFAGATFLSLADTRWAYATLGGTRRITPRTMLDAEANLGGGNDDGGGFGYVVLRGGVTRELLAKRLYGEAEWLQTDVARRQEGIARAGATWIANPRLTLRASLYQSLAGDTETTLGTLRGDYTFGRVTAIGGLSAGTANPALSQQPVDHHVREAFGGVTVERWTILLTVGEERQRLTVTRRIAVGAR
jgi:hypothetical protein